MMTKKEIFENFFLSVISYSDVIVKIDGENFNYFHDYIWSIKEIEDTIAYSKPNELEQDLEQFKEEQEKINMFETYLRTLKIEKINEIIDILPIFVKTCLKFQFHDLSQIGVVLGCSCGCGGDKLTQKDYEEYEALKLKIESILNKVQKLLNI